MKAAEPQARDGPYCIRPSRLSPRASASISGDNAEDTIPCPAVTSRIGRKPCSGTYISAPQVAASAVQNSTMPREPTRSANAPQAGPQMTRNSDATPSTVPIEAADRPRSENHSGRYAP